MVKIFLEKFNSPDTKVTFTKVTIILIFSWISMKVFLFVLKIFILRNIIIYFYLVIKLMVTLSPVKATMYS